MKEIPISELDNIRIGQTEDAEAGTGCTVILCEKGMAAGADIRGGGPASRETPLLSPMTNAHFIHAVVLSGGSAFGLDAAGGVMDCLEQHNIGYDVSVTKVPLVVQSDIFDLTVGDVHVRPDRDMGYKAAELALNAPNYRDGNYGAGCGATVGKIMGMTRSMKSGIGSYAVQTGDLKVGAVVVVNALGDIYDHHTGKQIAGLRSEDGTALCSTLDCMYSGLRAGEKSFARNTTLAVIMTNASFHKTALCRIAAMGHNGMARSINPVHTTADGDTVYAVSAGDVKADQDLVGTLGAEVLSEAILRAVRSAVSAYGLSAACDLK